MVFRSYEERSLFKGKGSIYMTEVNLFVDIFIAKTLNLMLTNEVGYLQAW